MRRHTIRPYPSSKWPTRTWRLEPAEAPVLLIAAVGTSPADPLSRVLERAVALAGVLVLEDVGESQR